MALVSRVLRSTEGGYIFKCPGCKDIHVVNLDPSKTPCWQFNGNVDKPTFRNSVLVQGIRLDLTDEQYEEYDAYYAALENKHDIFESKFASRCHSYVTDGTIQFLEDCTHDLKNQTVQLGEFTGEIFKPD